MNKPGSSRMIASLQGLSTLKDKGETAMARGKVAWMRGLLRMALVAVMAVGFGVAGIVSNAGAAVSFDNAATSMTIVGTGTTSTNVTGTIAKGTGSNRVLLVVLTVGNSAAVTANLSTTTVTYGGQSLTPIAWTSTQRSAIWAGYLKEAGIVAATNTTISATISSASIAGSKLVAAVFQDVLSGAADNPIQSYATGLKDAYDTAAVTISTPANNVTVPANGYSIVAVSGNQTTATAYTWSPAAYEGTAQEWVNTTSHTAGGSSHAGGATDVVETNISATPNNTSRLSLVAVTLKPAPTDATPPTAGTVTATPQSGTYVPADFSISTSFTDAESAVTSCEYTLNGSTWSAGTVSGSGPYTCTANVTGQTNGAALTINMRATSSGGTGTATAINRTVDAAAPTTSASPAGGTYTSDQSVTLTPTDAASGVASTLYCVDAVNSCVPGSTYSAAVAVAGVADTNVIRYLRFASTDNLGNAEMVKSETYTLNRAEAPIVTAFTIPATVTDTAAPLEIPITTFTATDNVAVTGYMITESATAPGAGDAGWLGSAPTSYTVPAYASYTLYAWAKDAAGNVSLSASASTVISNCTPTVTAISIAATTNPINYPATSTTFTVTRSGGSGTISSTKYSVDGGTWTATATPYVAPSQSVGSVSVSGQAVEDNCGTIMTTATPVTVNYDTRTPYIVAGTSSAAQLGTNQVKVTMPYLGNDSDGSARFTVSYTVNGGAPTQVGPSTDADKTSPYEVTLAGPFAEGDAVAVTVTYDDAAAWTAAGYTESNAIQGPFTVTILTWSDSYLLHNSNRFACTVSGYFTGATAAADCAAAGGTWQLDRKWTVAGDGPEWGTSDANDVYGPINCATCHKKNAAPNIKRIKDSIVASRGTFPGQSATVVADNAATSYGADNTVHVNPATTRVCESCHSQNSVHNYSMAAAVAHNGNNCIDCHEHKVGFRASCAACHGNPPETGKLVTTKPTGSTTAGAHLAHNSTLAIACAQCHYSSVGSGAKHNIDGTVTLGFVDLPTGTGGSDIGSYTGQNVGGGKVKYDSSDAGTTVKNSGDVGFGTKTCANYCHGSTIVDGSAKSPVWDGASPIACGTCHRGNNAGMDNASALGSHQTHAGSTKENLACTACHGAAAGNLIIAGLDATNHVDGTVTWNVTGLTKHYSSASNPDYKASPSGSTGALAPTAPASYGTCRNLACHWGTETPKWGVGPATCDTCHPASPTSGSHTVHVGANSVYVGCDDCHGAGATTGTHGGHIDNFTNFAGKLTAGTNFTDVGGRANTADTCAVICHQSGTWGGTLNWTAGVTGNCIDCHSNLFHSSGNAGPVVVTGVAADTTGGTGSHMKSLPSQSIPTTAADWTTRCQLCHDKHSGTISIPLPATDALKTALGINYPGSDHGAIKLRAIGGSTSEAQTCWNCHDTATTTDKTLSGVNVTFTNPATVGATNIGAKFAIGDWITITGSSSAANNRTFKVATSSANSITVTIPTGAASLTAVASAAGVTIVSPVSEWSVNENTATGAIDYDYGYLYTNTTMPGTMTSDWTSAVWRSGKGRLSGTGYGAYNPFVYKQGSIQSTHTADLGVTDSNLTGSAYNYAETKNSASEIRCTYCHDVHDLNKATGDATAGVPFLRGSWKGNPYPEDGAPRWGMLNFTADGLASNATDYSQSFGRVPRGSANAANSGLTTVPKAGGWWIDQNSGNPNYVSGAYQTATATSGLCALCHGSDNNATWTSAELGAIDQKSGENLWVSGFNGHANVVLGGPGRSANATAATDESARRNIFTRTLRGSATATAGEVGGYVPTAYADMGLATGTNEGYSYRSADDNGYLAYPRVMTNSATASASGRAYAYETFVWGAAAPYDYQRTTPTSAIAANTAQLQVSDQSAPLANGTTDTEATYYDAQANYHTFTCSKCHNPHASRLPKLMITNCLDTNHNDWDNYTDGTHQYGVSYTSTTGTTTQAWPSVWAGSRSSQHAAAQNCHRLDDRAPVDGTTTRGPGWNKVTPWDQYATPNSVINTNPNP